VATEPSDSDASRVRVPAQARRGEAVQIRALLKHPMESGFHYDAVGKPIPRHIVVEFSCVYNGEEVLRVKLFPAVSANPYFSFYATAVDSGELVFTWRDDRGNQWTDRATIEVVG
jgi:sulfur-oxidizing protein SoxZ